MLCNMLILGVVFYDYIPTNKVIPSTVEPYTTSNTIKERNKPGNYRISKTDDCYGNNRLRS